MGIPSTMPLWAVLGFFCSWAPRHKSRFFGRKRLSRIYTGFWTGKLDVVRAGFFTNDQEICNEDVPDV
jgi:hypothetical protein